MYHTTNVASSSKAEGYKTNEDAIKKRSKITLKYTRALLGGDTTRQGYAVGVGMKEVWEGGYAPTTFLAKHE